MLSYWRDLTIMVPDAFSAVEVFQAAFARAAAEVNAIALEGLSEGEIGRRAFARYARDNDRDS